MTTSSTNSVALTLGALAIALLVPPVARAAGDTFASLMDSAMTRMDRDMMVAPSGDADRDFAAMMIPHHQGAIDMAKGELRFGHDLVLRRLAEGIIVEQQQEIVVMRQALEARPQAHSTTAPTPSMHHHNGTN